jgi:two-component system phosphate regulon sensor histidine kinase PhoR
VAEDDQLALADRLGVGMLLLDQSGRISAANESAHRLLAARLGTLPGKTTMEAFVDHTIDRVVREATSGSAVQSELTLPTEPPRTMVIRAYRMPHGGAAVLLEDVSELRRLRRIRTEFMDNLSHELRTPLTTVRLLTESLALEIERTDASPRVRDSVTKIDVETEHLVQMVNELLDLAKIEQGEAPLQMRDIDLATVVGGTLDRLRLYADRNGVELRSEMPDAAADRTVRGDSERLSQLLVNLVHNAVKFSPRETEVMVRVRPLESEIVIEVADHGVGIPRRDLERVFERFYKVDRARTDGAVGGGGTGLGLSIARHIAERHGGRVSVASEEGKGSTLTVALPRAATSA